MGIILCWFFSLCYVFFYEVLCWNTFLWSLLYDFDVGALVSNDVGILYKNICDFPLRRCFKEYWKLLVKWIVIPLYLCFKEVWHSCFKLNSDLFIEIFMLGINGVLQLVSEQVGLSGQVVEYLCHVTVNILSLWCCCSNCWLSCSYRIWLVLRQQMRIVWSEVYFRGRKFYKLGRVVTPTFYLIIYLVEFECFF